MEARKARKINKKPLKNYWSPEAVWKVLPSGWSVWFHGSLTLFHALNLYRHRTLERSTHHHSPPLLSLALCSRHSCRCPLYEPEMERRRLSISGGHLTVECTVKGIQWNYSLWLKKGSLGRTTKIPSANTEKTLQKKNQCKWYLRGTPSCMIYVRSLRIKWPLTFTYSCRFLRR